MFINIKKRFESESIRFFGLNKNIIMILVQIGSGSSNLDTFFEDGFANFIQKKKN